MYKKLIYWIAFSLFLFVQIVMIRIIISNNNSIKTLTKINRYQLEIAKSHENRISNLEKEEYGK